MESHVSKAPSNSSLPQPYRSYQWRYALCFSFWAAFALTLLMKCVTMELLQKAERDFLSLSSFSVLNQRSIGKGFQSTKLNALAARLWNVAVKCLLKSSMLLLFPRATTMAEDVLGFGVPSGSFRGLMLFACRSCATSCSQVDLPEAK